MPLFQYLAKHSNILGFALCFPAFGFLIFLVCHGPLAKQTERPVPAATLQAMSLTGKTAEEALLASGAYDSLGVALRSARHAVQKIEPRQAGGRGASHFASNPRQRMRAWFHPDGVELAGLRSTGDEWSLTMKLSAAGREGMTQKLGQSSLSALENRVEMNSTAEGFTQWFENRAEGLEQGFTFQTRPAGRGRLEVVLKTEGALKAAPLAGAESSSISFANLQGKEVMHYRHLRAWDADGRELPASMEVRGPEVALHVMDEGARYPVTIDPLFVNVEARLMTDSGAGDEFGTAVALNGDIAAVSAPKDDTQFGSNAGSVYVFVRSGTEWRHLTQLIPADGAADELFGASLSMNADMICVGSPLKDTQAGTDAGCVYVFNRSGEMWAQQTVINTADAEAGDLFGTSICLNGSSILIGATQGGPSAGSNFGCAYVFTQSGSTWTQEAKLTASDGAADDQLGTSVSLSDNTAVIGAPFDDTVNGPNFGSAYVFLRSGNIWSQQAKIAAADGALQDRFGTSVAVDANTALVGSPYSESSDAGSAYVYIRSGSTWSQQAKFVSNKTNLGQSVALQADTAVVGYPSGSGGILVFSRSGTAWSQQASLTVSGGSVGGNPGGLIYPSLGGAVAINGTSIIAGARGYDTEGGLDAGIAQVFALHPTLLNWQSQMQLLAETSALNDCYGTSIALSGDTAVIGAPFDRALNFSSNVGSAYVFLRQNGLWRFQAKLFPGEFRDQANNKQFGSSVALEGDTALVGAPIGQTGGGATELAGRVYVFVRTGSIWNQQAELTASDAADGDAFGQAVALSGETALIGAPYDDAPTGNDDTTGSAYVFVRSGSTWTEQTKLSVSGSPQGTFGYAVALEGDTALISAPYARGGDGPPKAFVYVRSGTSWSQQAAMLCPDGDNFNFGFSVALSGNTGLIGTPREVVNGTPLPGSVYAFVRSGAVWGQQAKLTPNDGAAFDQFGYSVALEGNSALIGARWDDSAFGENTGSAYLYTRNGTLWSQQAKFTSSVDASSSDEFGTSVALDGATAVVGAPKDDTSGTDAGSAYVFLVGEFPAVITPPVSRTVAPGQLVTFSVTASGYGTLQYQWRKNGVEITGQTGTSYTIPSVVAEDAGLYDVVVSNAGGVATSAPATLTVNILSQFTQVFPGTVPEAEGSLIVNLTPAGLLHGWRFIGEQQWRAAGVAVGGLTTGDREIEFRPVPGYIHPPAESTVNVISGGATTILTRDYYETAVTGSGGLSVTLKPDSITSGPDRAQWRLLGENDTQWRDSGATLAGLIPGSYLIECKPVSGRSTPPNATVIISAGQTAAPTLTYFLASTATGALPAVLAFETVTTDQTKPYAYVGQIRSNVGASTGFAVKERVVATAAHVVWDDGTLSAAQGLQWLFQRHRGSYEPVPQAPRGFYMLAGYAAQRQAENSPGSFSPQSRNLDVAAMYFLAAAARGGHGGFLASDLDANEFLLSNANKMLVGYPVDGVATGSQGRMHATTPGNIVFSALGVSANRTYLTTGIRSTGGASGGPLCVQYDGGNYFPAAIYLGGTEQTLVRAIDSAVIDLFNRAELSGIDDLPHTGGGITHTSVSVYGSSSNPGALKVLIEPAGAVNGGAGWRLSPETTYRLSGAQKLGLNAGTYVLQLIPVAGYDAPAAQSVAVTGGQLTTVTYTYAQPLTPQESWRQTNFGITANSGSAADEADPDGDGMNNVAEYTAGTNPNSAVDRFRVHSHTKSGSTFNVTTAGKTGRTYILERTTVLNPASWGTVAVQGPLGGDATLTLTDTAAPAGTAFYRIRVTGP